MVGWKRKRIDNDDNNTSRRMEEAQIASSLMSVR